jgi:microcystin-dependent protein
MAYNITNSRGDVIAIVQSGQENTTATSLTLLGANYPQYGLQQNENFVYLLENFADTTAPSNPVLGQLWFNSSTNVLSVYDINAEWTALATQDYVQAQKISPVFTGVPTAPTADTSTGSTQIATTAFVQNVVDSRGFAPLDSPVFVGTPRAPTVSGNTTSTTEIATTAFVNRVFADTNLSLYATKNNATLTGVPTVPTAPSSTANEQIASTAFVSNLFNDINLSPYAVKASPTFTGVPRAPTPAVSTNDTQIATTAFTNALFNSIDLSPYAPKASPTFTGVPTAPSPAASDNSSQIATAQFVQQQKISPNFTGTPTAPTAAASTSTTQIATTEFVQTALNNVQGIGTVSELAGSVKMWAGALPPANWAFADGAAISRSLYPALFARIGTTFGNGDGSTTFNLPNFTNRVGIGAGGTFARGATGGTADAVVVQHTHNFSMNTNSAGTHAHTVNNQTGNGPQWIAFSRDDINPSAPQNEGTGYQLGNAGNDRIFYINENGAHSHSVTGSINPTGSTPTNANLPPYIACFWIIKLSDDGSGGGTLQAGTGIDIETSGAYSTITNTGVLRLTAGTGITLSSGTGNVTISSADAGISLRAGQGISISTAGNVYTITNTVNQNPVVAGPGVTVQNATGGALVSANVRSIIAGSGINVSESTTGNFVINNTVTGAGLGYDQSWQDVKNSRAFNTNYTNDTGKPIMVSVSVTQTATAFAYTQVRAFVNDLVIADNTATSAGSVVSSGVQFIVPPGATYRIQRVNNTNIKIWTELR